MVEILTITTGTILEGLKLAFPDATVTRSVGTGITGYDGPILGPHTQMETNKANQNGIDPFWTVIQRHSFSLASDFSPTMPSSPYKNLSTTPKLLPAGTQGLQATYFANTDCSGEPVMTRLDFAPNFHWFALGPHPVRMRNGTFCVRWEGVITPDTTVQGAIQHWPKSRFTTRIPVVWVANRG